MPKDPDQTTGRQAMAGTRSLPVRRLKPVARQDGRRDVAAEVPVALTYNGVSHVVMMMTPQHLEDFAVGFSLSEAVVETIDEVREVEVRPVEPGILIAAQIPQPRFEALLARGRNMVGQTGCGLCGIVDLETAVRPVTTRCPRPDLSLEAAFAALDALGAHQPLNRATGAVHAAAFADPSGAVRMVREDVGRHNALDKLIGGVARAGQRFDAGFVVMTSRCSFELVQKAVTVGVPALVTISAPTDLAVRLAADAGLTLIALARSDAMLAFNDPHGLFADD